MKYEKPIVFEIGEKTQDIIQTSEITSTVLDNFVGNVVTTNMGQRKAENFFNN